jgi:hypothetical protein
MEKKKKYILIGGVIIGLLLIVSYAFSSSAMFGNIYNPSTSSGIIPINRGGLATSTAPAAGQVLMGIAGGKYNLVSTSSLGISVGAETDPIFMSASTSLAYQPIGSYLTAETDPVWLAASTTYAKLASPTFTGTYNFATASGTAITATNFYGTCSAAASDSAWTTHNSYPAACSAGQYVSAVGDTLTCSSPSSAGSVWATSSATQLYVTGYNVGIGTTTPYKLFSVASSSGEVFGIGSDNTVSIGSGTAVLSSDSASTTIAGIWNMSGATVKQHIYKSFTFPGVATTTTATTTVPLGQAYVAELWNGVNCRTTAATSSYEFSDGTNKMNSLTATTTATQFTLSTNNTFTAGERRDLNVGALTAAQLTCTVDIIVNN